MSSQLEPTLAEWARGIHVRRADIEWRERITQ